MCLCHCLCLCHFGPNKRTTQLCLCVPPWSRLTFAVSLNATTFSILDFLLRYISHIMPRRVYLRVLVYVPSTRSCNPVNVHLYSTRCRCRCRIWTRIRIGIRIWESRRPHLICLICQVAMLCKCLWLCIPA